MSDRDRADAAGFDISALIETSDDAIIGKTLQNIIRTWNQGAERIYGYKAGEIIGQSSAILVPDDRKDEPDELIGRVRQGERIEHLETVRITKGGTRVHVSLTMWPARDRAGHIVGAFSIGRDITARKSSELTVNVLQRSAAARALVLETANRVALDILASRTGNEALRHIAEAARVLARARYAALGVASPDGRDLMHFVTVGLTAEEERVIGSRPRGAGILGFLLQRTEPLRIDVLADHPMSVGFPPNHPPMNSFLGVPIRRGEVIFGSLYLTNKDGGGAFTEADQVAVEALGAHAAVAIHNLHLLGRQRTLISGLIAAQEEERRTVAYDLHDGLTQFVMASHAHMEAFRRWHAAGNEEKAGCELDKGLRYLKEAVIESRRMVNGLRSLALDDLGLAGALELLLGEEKLRAGWSNADFYHNVSGRRYDKDLETTAYRVAQEGLTNARKHAETDRVRLTLLHESADSIHSDQLVLEIQDWGRGFDPDGPPVKAAHVGLQSMHERVHLLGGAYQINSVPGCGTSIRAVLPVVQELDLASVNVGEHAT